MLFLVATPVGNLADITFRAINVLKDCDYILCEDTRHTSILLAHYEISKPLKSFHQFNESQKENSIIADLKKGIKIALVSDAGTPGISDPGSKLVQKCVEEQIQVISIPGACAAIMALSSSGFDTDRFEFFGFLPKKQSELKRTLQELLQYPGTTICYESPKRLVDVLTMLNELVPTRRIAVARELSKKFEEIQRGIPQVVLDAWAGREVKGEIVLLISGAVKQFDSWADLTPEEHVKQLEETYQIDHREAIKIAAELRGVSKRDVYNALVKKKNS